MIVVLPEALPKVQKLGLKWNIVGRNAFIQSEADEIGGLVMETLMDQGFHLSSTSVDAIDNVVHVSVDTQKSNGLSDDLKSKIRKSAEPVVTKFANDHGRPVPEVRVARDDQPD